MLYVRGFQHSNCHVMKDNKGLGSFLQRYELCISGTSSHTKFAEVSHRMAEADYFKGDYKLISFVE